MLFNNFSYDAGTNSTTTLTDSKPQSLFHSDRRNQVDNHLYVVTRHYHLGAFRQLYRTRYIRRAEVKLRTIALEERCMTATLILGQNVNLCLELRVRRNRARLRQYLTTLTISISSPTLTTPRSMRPVTTVPRPEIENTSSTGIR